MINRNSLRNVFRLQSEENQLDVRPKTAALSIMSQCVFLIRGSFSRGRFFLTRFPCVAKTCQ